MDLDFTRSNCRKQLELGKGSNLALDMNNALASNPGLRLLQVPAGDYTVGNVSIQTPA